MADNFGAKNVFGTLKFSNQIFYCQKYIKMTSIVV